MGKRSRKRSSAPSAGGAPRRPSASGSGGAPAKPQWKAGSTGSGAKPRRPAAPGAAGSGGPHAKPVARRARRDEAPPAPWSPFPLVELCILIGLILIIVAFVVGGDILIPLLLIGFALIAVSAVELAIREHFAGYRSHTTLLSGATVFVPMVPVYLIAGANQQLILGVGAITFALTFFVLRGAFARRAGGLGFRA
ncbi:hypothetical protein DSM112329_01514 [Paraconexibacter sp. AEG42_29]|uniref:Phosphatidate cytidylyltransferase n=1 Tax=Paraconexibacter sp. AEG42_29 TaxID=2997339 RepID=A0AAU7ASW7_9ACTN